jgi:ectoine hydroxylase-related dioxygenase (phytanoyl-CoA dioxygenase family)
VSELRTHGVREFQRNADAYDLCVEEIKSIGYTVIDSGYTPQQLETIRRRIDAIYEQQVREIGGAENLSRVNDADIARALLAYDDLFLDLATHDGIMSITKRLLGEVFILMSQNAVINRPTDSHYQVTWHRDLNYQHWVSSRPLAISALYAIDDFSDVTGGTLLIPASHKVEAFPSDDYARKHQIAVTAKAGSILVFDAMLFHRSGSNRSNNVRRAVNHIYTLPLIKQQISFPRMLNGKFGDDPFLRYFLGYDSETGESVQAWRERKLAVADAVPAAAANE